MEGPMTTARLVAMTCLLIAVGATRAHGQSDTTSANAIMPGCQAFLSPQLNDSPVSLFKQGQCSGYVSGVLNIANVLGGVCSPSEVTIGQAIRVVIQFINARPARMHEGFASLAFEALKAAWPCK
jgi:hypothetical protein